MNNEKGNKSIILASVIGLLVLVGLGGFLFTRKDTDGEGNEMIKADDSVSKNTNVATTAPTTKGVYKDGTYEAKGDYVSPGGAEEIDVRVTLTKNVITDSSVAAMATRPTSKMMQQDFVANYKSLVIGKNIDEVMLTQVSGSSLTPKGFNDAIAKIKSQAAQ